MASAFLSLGQWPMGWWEKGFEGYEKQIGGGEEVSVCAGPE